MSVQLPGPLALDMPPGDPSAVDDLVRDVDGAAHRLGVLADQLSGPAGAAPGWLGADAAAAAAQLTRVASITRGSAVAVRAAAGRLSIHAEVLRDARRAVTALRAEQDEDFRTAWQRLGQIEDPRLAVMTGSSAWAGVVAELEAAEARRRRRHTRVLEEVADDAAATVRALADAGRPVGGTGRAGDGGRVLAHLAAELPGWGDPELARRGRVLADALMHGGTPEERARLAAQAVDLAGHPAFATALIRELGVERFGLLLDSLGHEPAGPDHPLGAVLAAALGAAVPSGRPRDGVAAVLGATYVRAGDRYGAGARAAGMAAVLSAGSRSTAGGPGMQTVGAWARQLLLRERAQEMPTAFPAPGMPWREDARDPVQLAVETLARGGHPAAAADLLGDGRVWEALLDRLWGDGAAALGDLVAQAGRDSGPAGDRAVRIGLETIGAGLVEGDPSDRTVDRDVVAAVAPALGEAAAAHVDVVAGALASLSAEGGGDGGADQARGLGYVTIDRGAATAVGAALSGWVGTRSFDLAGTSRADPLPAVAVLAAFDAVQEYGQRLTYALDGFELQAEAEDRAQLWNWTAGPLLEAVSYVRVAPIAVVADVIAAYGPLVLRMDGTFVHDPDGGLSFAADDASAHVLASLPPDLAARAAAVESQAESAFRRVAERLGDPRAPVSPGPDWAGATLELVTGGMSDLSTDELRDRAGRAGAGGVPGRR